ncbi:XisI protein [Microseira wollei NIES-4236]|uniref:XisI protein n=1 Tax=Microseira wollei NIES-4236 TaxID=2530354 RepID=A0AAV3X1W2_9CYAN|nr:XisI protein [Microseira wollei NIES-4236]
METLEKYRQIVRDLLNSHATTNDPDIECQIIFDTERDRYLLLDRKKQTSNSKKKLACPKIRGTLVAFVQANAR